MATAKVWTERESGKGWTDCCYCANLMVLVAAGKSSFPLGIYTRAECNELEKHDNRTDDTGATFMDSDLAIRDRYGVTMGGGGARWNTAGLRGLLADTSKAFALAGLNAKLPSNVEDWSPGFTGAHAVCVIPKGGGNVLWLDPLAPDQYAGQTVTVDAVVAWASALNGDSHDPRFLTLDQLAPKEETVEILGTYERGDYGAGTRRLVTVSAPFREAPAKASPTLATYAPGTSVPGTVVVSAEGAEWYVAILFVSVKGYCLGYLHEEVFKAPAGADWVEDAEPYRADVQLRKGDPIYSAPRNAANAVAMTLGSDFVAEVACKVQGDSVGGSNEWLAYPLNSGGWRCFPRTQAETITEQEV